jgi:hypothetical protein
MTTFTDQTFRMTEPDTWVAAAPGDETIEEMADRLDRLTEAVASSLRTAYRFALEAGRGLKLARNRVPRDRWQDWVRDNCYVSHRMAQVYINMAAAVDGADTEGEWTKERELAMEEAKLLRLEAGKEGLLHLSSRSSNDLLEI